MTSCTLWQETRCAWFWGVGSRLKRLFWTFTMNLTTSMSTNVSDCSTKGFYMFIFPYMSENTCSYHAIIVHSLMFDRYYWQTMKPDVVQWINNCSRCSLKIKQKPCRRAEADRSETQSLTSAQHSSHRWSGSSYYIIVEGRNIKLPTPLTSLENFIFTALFMYRLLYRTTK